MPRSKTKPNQTKPNQTEPKGRMLLIVMDIAGKSDKFALNASARHLVVVLRTPPKTNSLSMKYGL